VKFYFFLLQNYEVSTATLQTLYRLSTAYYRLATDSLQPTTDLLQTLYSPLQTCYRLSTAHYRLATDLLQPTTDSLQTLYSLLQPTMDSLQPPMDWLQPHYSSAAAVPLQCCAEHRGCYRHYSTTALCSTAAVPLRHHAANQGLLM
jgi:hypothetical protein